MITECNNMNRPFSIIFSIYITLYKNDSATVQNYNYLRRSDTPYPLSLGFNSDT